MIAGVNGLDKQAHPSTHPARSGRRRVAVAGGGTAGHVTSAVAILAAYRANFDADVYFIGCRDGFAARLIPAGGFELKIIPIAPYVRQSMAGKAWALVELVRETLAARRLLKARQTDLVIGLGGYASLGAILAAKLLGIPSVIHEANVFPGLANRMLGSLADRVFLGWEQARGSFQTKSVVTGNPIRRNMGALARQLREPGRDLQIVVTGGSAGSPFLNENVPLLLARVRDLGVPLKVRHQAGAGETERVRGRYQGQGIQARIEEFIDDMAAAYRESDYVITAAGALTLAELAMAGLPALLVPQSAAAGGHQIANAEVYSELSGGAWVREEDWDSERLAVSLAATLGDLDVLVAQANRLRGWAHRTRRRSWWKNAKLSWTDIRAGNNCDSKYRTCCNTRVVSGIANSLGLLLTVRGP